MQSSLPLYIAGYREASPLSDCWPFRPTYARVDAIMRRAGGVGVTRAYWPDAMASELSR